MTAGRFAASKATTARPAPEWPNKRGLGPGTPPASNLRSARRRERGEETPVDNDRMRMVVRLGLAVAVCLAIAGAMPAAAQAQPADGGWQFELTPFVWLSGMSGTMGAGATSAHVSASFSDIAKSVDSALMVDFVARDGRWGFIADPYYVDVAETVPTPYGYDVDIKSKQIMLGVAGSYRAYEREGSAIDLLFGGRYNQLESELRQSGTSFPVYTFKKDWVDPFVGFRSRLPLGERWDFDLRGDIGGFSVGSKLAWDATASLDFRLGKVVSLKAGYGVVSTDYESGSGDSHFLYDVRMEGPSVAAIFRF